MLEVKPSEVVLCVPKNSMDILAPSIKEYEDVFPSIRVVEGLVDETDFENHFGNHHKLIIFDDNYNDLIQSQRINKLMVFSGRKSNISTIILTQNIFQASKYSVSIRRQQQYHVIFDNFNDRASINNISRQFFPNRSSLLLESLEILKNEKFKPFQTYIFYDAHPMSPFNSSMRVRSNIFDHENPYFFTID